MTRALGSQSSQARVPARRSVRRHVRRDGADPDGDADRPSRRRSGFASSRPDTRRERRMITGPLVLDRHRVRLVVVAVARSTATTTGFGPVDQQVTARQSVGAAVVGAVVDAVLRAVGLVVLMVPARVGLAVRSTVTRWWSRSVLCADLEVAHAPQVCGSRPEEFAQEIFRKKFRRGFPPKRGPIGGQVRGSRAERISGQLSANFFSGGRLILSVACWGERSIERTLSEQTDARAAKRTRSPVTQVEPARSETAGPVVAAPQSRTERNRDRAIPRRPPTPPSVPRSPKKGPPC